MIVKLSILPIILLSFAYAIPTNMRDIPPAPDYQTSLKQIPLKKNILLDRWLNYELNEFPFDRGNNKAQKSLLAAIVRLEKKQKIHEVEQYLLSPHFKTAKVGTRINLVLGLCKRKGDYDFILQYLIRMAYLGKTSLAKKTYNHLIYNLLTQRGTDHYKYFKLGLCGKREDTENHILMTESARYLTNQLLFKQTSKDEYNNNKNGFDQWMLNYLKPFFVKGFSEINSRPYQGYTILPLLNLFDYAENKSIKEAAKIIIDSLVAKFYIFGSGGRRLVSFRRQKKYKDYLTLEIGSPLTCMIHYWVGNYDYIYNHQRKNKIIKQLSEYQNEKWSLISAISNYLPSPYLHQLFFESTNYFQVIKHLHHGLYASYKSPTFTIISGGVHRKMWPKVSKTNDVFAEDSIVLSRRYGRSKKDFLRFEGRRKAEKRNNNCITKHLLCGQRLVIPKSIESCLNKTGNFLFYQYNSKLCPQSPYKNQFISILYDERKEIGFIEIVEAQLNDFAKFRQNILVGNTGKIDIIGTYTNSSGQKIQYNIDSSRGRNIILSKKINFKNHLQGDFMISDENSIKYIIKNKKFLVTWPAK